MARIPFHLSTHRTLKKKFLSAIAFAAFSLSVGQASAASLAVDWINANGMGTVPGTTITYTINGLPSGAVDWPGANPATVAGGGNTYTWATTDQQREQSGESPTITIVFSAPVPTEKIALAAGQLDSGFAKFFLQGGTANGNDFTFVGSDLGAGANGYDSFGPNPSSPNSKWAVPSGPSPHGHAFYFGNSSDTVTRIDWEGAGISGADTTQWGVGFVSVIPEPSSALLLGVGLLAMGVRRRGR